MKNCLIIKWNNTKTTDLIELKLNLLKNRKHIIFITNGPDRFIIEPDFMFGIRGGLRPILYGELIKHNSDVDIKIEVKIKFVPYIIAIIITIIVLYYKHLMLMIIALFIIININLLYFIIQKIYCLNAIKEIINTETPDNGKAI